MKKPLNINSRKRKRLFLSDLKKGDVIRLEYPHSSNQYASRFSTIRCRLVYAKYLNSDLFKVLWCDETWWVIRIGKEATFNNSDMFYASKVSKTNWENDLYDYLFVSSL